MDRPSQDPLTFKGVAIGACSILIPTTHALGQLSGLQVSLLLSLLGLRDVEL